MAEYILHEETVTGKKYKPGTDFKCYVLIPDKGGEFGLYIGHDGRNEADERALLRLAEEGKAPYCVCIGVVAGTLALGGYERNMRMDDYDLFSAEYADFLVYELIPYITEKYKLRITGSPGYRMTSGGSSGGISAFSVAWFHPEYFGRVYMSSPSFLAMGRGNEIPVLIRKCETKPLRVYEEYSEHEPDDYFGSSYCAAREAETALKFAGYDFKCEYFPGEGHCSRRHDEAEAYKRLSWLWEGYASSPLCAPRSSPRAAAVVPEGSVWEKADAFPEEGSAKREVLSADRRMVYSGCEDREFIEKAPVCRREDKYCHGTLHTLAQVFPKGALDLAVDENDRLYVLTAIGIQCVRSFGLIDVILDLPDKSRPQRLALANGFLYLRTEQGVYRRRICARAAGNAPSEPKFVSYYD